ncbi:uncharacterized protein BP01DRAFT_370700 [Aspergillus saccharolyticus JOP 1030-1]|uniref:Uncharacterized protein n=1 Tax=Aspergillus saccharolyticus JOP 1030-1 TaxID=1450539 RepID=A0A318ZXW3_9EURO|nr:hypothetical protein BP01DRAFT_370700 [Aspergillus saccharolyticus JOP 1030-1]PYH49163.1 hypothetical protein BP01DRAFT_370700 [Aspergillus saccharolyticus JOP 1030-1]
MASKIHPLVAFCEEYDEDTHVIRPETRQVANITTKRHKQAVRSAAEPLVDVASDSGYSSRTAATVNSTQSGPSGRKSPVPHKSDTTLKRSDLERVRSKGHKERPSKDRIARPPREEKMQVGSFPHMGHPHPPAQAQRSPSRSRRRDSAHVRHYPGQCYECDQGLYHPTSTPVEARPMDFSYFMPPPPPTGHEYPPSAPQNPRYAPSVIQDVNVSRTSRPHARESSSMYHTNNRPVSFHGAMPGMGQMMYPPGSMGRHEHGPPLSTSAYAHAPYVTSHYPPQSPYYGMPDYAAPPESLQERSASRTRDQGRGRRPSLYAPPPMDFDDASFDESEDDDEGLDVPPPPPPAPSRSARPRMSAQSSHDHREEDYYRSMPPPPIKHKAAPHIIQKRPDPPRKSVTAPSITSDRRSSRSLDLSPLRDALPEYGYRQSSRETVMPERSRSNRDSRRSTAYHESARPARIAVENSRRRRPTVYNYGEEDDGDEDDEIVEKQREAEEYQASRSGKPSVPVPLTEDALYKAKTSQRAESDSGSQKSRSNSSRGSDARTQNGSSSGLKPEDDNSIVMKMNGVTMSFSQESVGGKRLMLRTGDNGAVELNIEGKHRAKKYLTGGSDYTASVSRRELEDPRRAMIDRKSDRASRRSSRSIYSGRG